MKTGHASGLPKNVGAFIEILGFDEFVGAADQFLEDRFEPFLEDGPGAAETQPADEGAEGIGDVFGAIAEIGAGGLVDASVLLDLPPHHEGPHASQ